jgi:hypothetical protein
MKCHTPITVYPQYFREKETPGLFQPGSHPALSPLTAMGVVVLLQAPQKAIIPTVVSATTNQM